MSTSSVSLRLTIAWTFLLFLAVALYDVIEGRQNIPKPSSCDASETWFRHRRRYVYNYKVLVEAGFVGSSDVITGALLSCVVNVNVPKRCEATVELSGCKLKERGFNGKMVPSPGSKELAALLEKDAVYVQMDRGRVLEQRLVVQEGEPVFITNIKRGVLSQLQLPILPIKQYDKPLVQHDIFGECPMHITFDAVTNSIHSHRDVYQCQLPQVFGLHMFSPSFAKQFHVQFFQQPVDILVNPFESMLDCQYKISGKKIARSTCTHNQAFKPLTFGGEHRVSSSINVTQSLSLASARRLPRKSSFVSRAMVGRQMVPLMMDMKMATSQEVTQSQVHEGLNRLLRTYSAQSDELPPDQFQFLVDVMRHAPQSLLEETVETLLTCRGETGDCELEQYSSQLDTKMVQSLRESFFTDGLLSCGTEACMATYITCIQRNMMISYLAEFSLFNMALFYQPAPAVISKMLTLCESSSSNNCWLTLGTLVNKLAEQIQASQDDQFIRDGKAAVREVLRHLRAALGDTCRPGILPASGDADLHDKLNSLLLVLKTLGNAGGAIQEFHDDANKKGKDLVTALLHCVNNPALTHKITNAALTALGKVEQNKKLHAALFDLLTNSTREVALRTIAFDRLVLREETETAQRLTDAIRQETMASMKIYMVTKVAHLLESNDPRLKSLRNLWRSNLASNPLEEFETLRGRGSQYAEFSKYVELPLDKSQHGAKLAASLIFEPASIVTSSQRVVLSFLFNNRSIELLELGLDFQGLENIVRLVLGPDFSLKKGLGAVIAQVMQSALPRKGELPTLFFNDKTVVEALKNLFLKVNMPTGDAPQAQFRVKVFGSEVGFINLEDIIRMAQSSSKAKDKGPSQIVTFAQKLSEGMQLFLGKSAKLVELEQIVPTVAGLPWKGRADGTMVASAMLNAGGDVMKFMTRKGPLEITGGLTTSVGVKVFFQEALQIGHITSSGIRMNVSVLVNGGLAGRLKYAPVPESKEAPGAQVLELGLGALKRPLNVISVRSDILQLHNGAEKALKTPDTQVEVSKCLPKFLQTWSGQKMCVQGFYQRVNFSVDYPFPLVSGPVHLDVNTRAVDNSLKEYTVTFTLTRQKQKDTPGVLVVVKANCLAPGDELQRKFDIVVKANAATKELHVESVVPEFGLYYGLDLHSTYGDMGSSKHHLLSSVMSLGPKVLHSLIVETNDELETKEVADPKTDEAMTFNMTESKVRVNASFPGVSIEVITNSTSGKTPGQYAQGIYIRYYCEPELGIFYALHGRPDLATENGHVSEWSVSNAVAMKGKSLAETIRGSQVMAVYIPGRNVTIANEMKGNYTWAHRDTTIFWSTEVGTANETTDIIRMESQVTNEFIGHKYNMQYVMTLVHEDQYDVTIEGTFVGPLSDMDFKSDVIYKAKEPKTRERRSLRGIYTRLKRVEESVESVVETAEEVIVRRGTELTEAFLRWVSGEASSPPSKQQQPDKAKEAEEQQQTTKVGEESQESSRVPQGAMAALHRLPMGPNIGYLLHFFMQPQWHLNIDAHVGVRPKMEAGSPKPVGYDCEWEMDISFPDLKEDLFYFNGTLYRGKAWDVDMDWRLHSDLLNFTLDYFMQQKVKSPRLYHLHRWNLEEFTKHRYDRSFTVLMDVERHDHFVYSLDLVSPSTNLSHAINFSTVGEVRAVRASMDLHRDHPEFDINYREMSNLTPKGLKTDVALNSTWLDLVLDMDVRWLPTGGIIVTKRIDSFGKVAFLNGSHQLDFDLKLDPSNRRRKPSLTFSHNDSQGEVIALQGQLLDPHLVLFTFTTQSQGAKKAKLLSWYIHLLEPTSLQHSLQWEPAMTPKLFGGALWFYTAGAHSFKTFGQTVADNVYRNVTDMVIPFTNTTISKVVNRMVQGQMKRVAMAGLDPKENVPFTGKILMGGLKAIQDLQTYLQNSKPGQVVSALGFHRVLSEAARVSTSLHYMVVQDPPFPLRQYIKFQVLPHLDRIAEDHQLNFTHPLPFVWDNYMSRPNPMMLRRQLNHGIQTVLFGYKSRFPFLAVVTRDKIQTFDGTPFDISIPRDSNCTYLLATDLVVGNHSVLLSDNSASVALREASVTLDWDGLVKINHSDKAVNKLPATLGSDGSTVTLAEGQVIVGVPSEARVTYDPVSQIYVIEAASHTHNRSVGLLGTNTRDSGDDFLLPSGRMASNSSDFQQEYELSGDEGCNKDDDAVSSLECDPDSSLVCTQLFQQSDSLLSSCFPAIDPLQFLSLCLERVCSMVPPVPSNACPVVWTYAKMCAGRGYRLDRTDKALLGVCGGCNTAENQMDIVFGSALDGTERSTGDLTHVIFNLASQLDDDTRYGFVHSHKQHVHAHLFDGQLFVESKKMKSLKKLESHPSDKNVSVKAILETASHYPFRPYARRFVVLLTGDQTPDLSGTKDLQEMMKNREVSIVLVSADLDSQRVLSVTWDHKVVCRGCSKNDVTMPTTEIGKLAAATRGMWMSLDSLETGRRTRLRKMMRPFEQIARQPAPLCAAMQNKGA
ncbi:uncharacterized protein [Littorina saxatilis]|uniref:uncharacterized protein isoform X2 n=1 Tax=Littorina saxatilis TaxID=31220 RepID=UPI0038B606E9